MRTNKNTSKIILAVIVAFLATMVSYSAFSNMQSQLSEQKQLIDVMQKNPANSKETFAYAVSAKNLKAGEIVADEDVDFQNFDMIKKDAFETRSDVVNKVLLQDIQSGDVFTSAHIAKISGDDTSLREGYRALTLPADSFQGKSATMKQGSFVDIYSASNESPWVLENVRIISFESPKKTSGTDSTSAQQSNIMDASAITFEVSAGNISDFISNVSRTKLVLVTRGASDRKTIHKPIKSPKTYSASSNSMHGLPNLPASVPISDFQGSSNSTGLPEPIQPSVPQASVEVIEANVKSKVTFD